jgi:hypothetical protein
LANAAYHRALPSAFVNLVWVLIAGSALAYSLWAKAKISPVLDEGALPKSEPDEIERL